MPKYSKKAQETIKQVMHGYKKRQLKAGTSGERVANK